MTTSIGLVPAIQDLQQKVVQAANNPTARDKLIHWGLFCVVRHPKLEEKRVGCHKVLARMTLWNQSN